MGLNVAVTAFAADIVRVHVLVPVHPPVPDHPANVEPEAAVAVSVTVVPDEYEFEQLVVQVEFEPDENATVPDPVPPFV